METLKEICETLDRLTINERALLSLTENMEFEKEALDRAQDSLLAHLLFLKSEYQRLQKHFFKMKHLAEKELVCSKILSFNQISQKPLIGYLSLFKSSNIKIRKNRLSKVLVA